MLGGESEACRDANDDEARGGGALDVSPEGVDGGEDGAGGGHIGGDVGTEGQQSWVEAEERESDEGGADVEHFARGEEDEQGGGDGEEEGWEAGAKDESVSGVVAAVGGTIVEEKLVAVEVGFGFEEAVLEGRDLEVEGKQREGGELLDHRRVLGIEAEVVSLPAFVAGEDVIVFVPGEGLAVDGVDDLRGEDEEQRENRGGDPAVGASGDGCGVQRHWAWGHDMSGDGAAS